MKEHPFVVMQRHCKQAKVSPQEMLAYLLELLQNSHALIGATSGFSEGAQNKSTVIGEIQGFMSLERLDTFPTSLLAALELVLVVHQRLDLLNSQNEKDTQQNREGLARRAHVEMTFIQIIRELLNKAETQGLEAALRIEAMHKKSRLKNDPDEENDPQPTES